MWTTSNTNICLASFPWGLNPTLQKQLEVREEASGFKNKHWTCDALMCDPSYTGKEALL